MQHSTRSPDVFSIVPSASDTTYVSPFSFTYNGRPSGELLPYWERKDLLVKDDRSYLYQVVFRDPASGLEVRSEARAYADHDAIDWVIRFKNSGDAETPLLENIRPLDLQAIQNTENVILHYALGSEVAANDFENRSVKLFPGGNQKLCSMHGRSSRNHLPFFNLQTGDKGVIGAIGWTGSWEVTFTRDFEDGIRIAGGMPVTRFRLQPDEEVRTPSILLMNWAGDRVAAQNAWRRLLLNEIVPQNEGKPVVVPAFYSVWGTNTIDWHLATAKRLINEEVPIDGYWIDAGWYGDQPVVENANVFNTSWGLNRGSWRPSKDCYPDGFRSLTKTLSHNGIQSLLWFEVELGDEGSDLLLAHPEWFLFLPGEARGVLNLGNHKAREGITEIVSQVIRESQMTWYRHDFNVDPESYWRGGDAPDRVGLTEMHYVNGLYTFWDELIRLNPGLKIDNCSSGGRRIDLEALRRSVPLWRSDLTCNPSFDPVISQHHTAGLAPWVPLSAGVLGEASTYALRSCYSAGLVIDSGMCAPKDYPAEWLKAAVAEYQKVRPYIYGDYYPIQADDCLDVCWVIWQYHRPDLDAGVAIVLRRRHANSPEQEIKLSAIDELATFSVEIRKELGATDSKTMSGSELREIKIHLPTTSSSALIFYRQL